MWQKAYSLLTVIHATETYKYLGTILDSTLSLSTNLDKMYKKKMFLIYTCKYSDFMFFVLFYLSKFLAEVFLFSF